MSTKIHEGRINPFDHDLLQRAHRTFVRFFQGYFHGSPPGDYRWSENDEETGIYISADTGPAGGRTMPTIMVKLAPAAWAGLSIDTRSARDFASHQRTFSDAVNSSVVISCVDQTEVASRFLGWRCFTAIPEHKEGLLSNATIKAVHNTFQLSPPISADMVDKAFAGRFATQLVVGFTVQYQSVISDANEDFKVRVRSIRAAVERV